MAKFQMNEEALLGEKEKLESEVATIVQELGASEVGSEQAEKLVKKYQRTLDRLTYILISLAKVKFLSGVLTDSNDTGDSKAEEPGVNDLGGAADVPTA